MFQNIPTHTAPYSERWFHPSFFHNNCLFQGIFSPAVLFKNVLFPQTDIVSPFLVCQVFFCRWRQRGPDASYVIICCFDLNELTTKKKQDLKKTLCNTEIKFTHNFIVHFIFCLYSFRGFFLNNVWIIYLMLTILATLGLQSLKPWNMSLLALWTSNFYLHPYILLGKCLSHCQRISTMKLIHMKASKFLGL